jgi:hypothetical protein
MQNDRNDLFSDLSVTQTETLLAGIGVLPLSPGAAKRVRSRVEKAAVPKAPRRRAAVRAMASLAACAAVIAVFFVCFPKAAQAVASFFGIDYTPSRYMNAAPESRTPVPSVEEALDAAAPADVGYTTTMLPKMKLPQPYEEYREQNGYEPYSEEDWAWVRDIRPEIAEVLYDGETLIWNTNLYTSHYGVEAFMRGFGYPGSDPDGQSADAIVFEATYTVAGDPTVYTLYSSGGGVTPIKDDAARENADHVVVYTDFYATGDEKLLPDGLITVTQTIRIAEGDAIDYSAAVGLIEHTFTLDATAGNTAAGNTVVKSVPLSGETYLSMDHYESEDGPADTWSMETKKVSLDGVSLNMETQYLPTGIRVRLTVGEAPESWTEDMKNALVRITRRNSDGTIESAGVCAELYVDGELIGDAQTPDSVSGYEIVYILPVFPDQYLNVSSVALKLTYTYYETFNGTDQLGGEVFVFPYGTCETDAVTGTVLLAEADVPLP